MASKKCISSIYWVKIKVILKREMKHMDKPNLTLHETMEIHELLNFKTICMMTSKLIQGVVFDQELKSLLEKDTRQSRQAVVVLQGLLDKTQLQ
jgi:similar to spore coat protein